MAGISAWMVCREPTLLRKQIPTRTFPLKPLYPRNTIERCLENALIQINAKQSSFSLQISVRNTHSPQLLNFYGLGLGLAHSTGVHPSFSWLPLGSRMELCRSNLFPGILQEKSCSESSPSVWGHSQLSPRHSQCSQSVPHVWEWDNF